MKGIELFMSNKIKILIPIIAVIGIGMLLILRTTHHYYGERNLFPSLNPLHLKQQKEILTQELERNKKYNDNINYYIEKLQLEDVGEIEGNTNIERPSLEEFISRYFATALIEDEQIFLAYTDPNVIINDKDINIVSGDVKKIIQAIIRDGSLQEIYLVSKKPKENNNTEVEVDLKYKDGQKQRLKFSIAKSTDMHFNSANYFMLSTSLSSLKKQLMG